MTTNILWCGGEDLEFQSGSAGSFNNTSTSLFAAGYARNSSRCGSSGNATTRGPAFSGGGVTSCWLHFMLVIGNTPTSRIICGLANSASGNGSGIYFGSHSSVSNKFGLYKWDGTTLTSLANSADSFVTGGSVYYPIDMQVISYGASSTINVYVCNSLFITYTGSSAISGVSSLDCVSLAGQDLNAFISEIIVADGDTRAMRLVTAAPNANGDSAGSWTNLYTSINSATIVDTNAIFNNATGSDFQCNCSDLPTGSFAIAGIKVAARAEVTAGATPTGYKLGVKTNSTVNVDGGHSPGASFTLGERLMTTNPVTSAAWTTTEANALQLDFQSM